MFTRLNSTNLLTLLSTDPLHSISVQLSKTPQKEIANHAINSSFISKVPLFQQKRSAHAVGAISTAQLNASLRLHLPPINVVVYNTPTKEHSSSGQFRT